MKKPNWLEVFLAILDIALTVMIIAIGVFCFFQFINKQQPTTGQLMFGIFYLIWINLRQKEK